MATLNEDILDAALEDGLIPKRLSSNQRLYVLPSILRANSIYWAIVLEEGIGYDQLAVRCELNPNTVKMYCAWMQDRGIVYQELMKSQVRLYPKRMVKRR